MQRLVHSANYDARVGAALSIITAIIVDVENEVKSPTQNQIRILGTVIVWLRATWEMIAT